MFSTWGDHSGLRTLRLAATVGLFSVLILWPTPLHADNAPLQPTTAGLVPGMPGTTVRMAAETVNLQIVERDHAVHAVVTASFEMFNRGPSVTLTTGFPRFSGTYFVPGGFAGFDPTQFAEFHASSGSTVFQPTIQPVKLQSESMFNGDWYVWPMDYPGNTSTRVEVAYDQTISSEINGYSYVSYILRTGTLWDGTIGDATITMSAGTGGAFLLPSGDEVKRSVGTQIQPVPQTLPNGGLPTSSSPTQVSWHLTDFKPSFDPFVFYVPADAWQRFSSSQTRLMASSPSADDYAAAVEAYFDALGHLPGGLPWVIRHGIPSQALRDRFDDVVAWANQATNLDPNNPAAWEALGDVQFFEEVRPGLFINCRPQLAPASYQKAVDLGSSAAQQKLDDISQMVRTGVEVNNGIQACALDSSQPTLDVTPDTLTDAVRSEILDAVNRANQVWKDTTLNLNAGELSDSVWVAGDLLKSDQAEVEKLRSAGQRRANTNTEFDVMDVTLDAPGRATVRTHETWSAVITSVATGAVLQQIPATTYSETYIVEFRNGGWVVTRNDV